MTKRKLLIPLDGSPFSHQLIPIVRSWFKHQGVALVLLHVGVLPPPLPNPTVSRRICQPVVFMPPTAVK